MSHPATPPGGPAGLPSDRLGPASHRPALPPDASGASAAWSALPYDLPGRQPDRSRTPLYVAGLIVAVVSGAALFASGYTLGLQQSFTPGTSAQNQQLFEPYWEAWNKVTTEYVGEFEPQTLVEGSIKGMFDALGDPFSSYMTSEEYKNSLAGISGEFEGIGAEMAAQDDQGAACSAVSGSCRLVIVHVLRDSPALRAGLMDGDILLAVDGESIDAWTVDQVVARVRGPKGTPVTLGLERDGQPLELSITRDVIRTEAVSSRVMAGGQVGYVKIDGFSTAAADDFVAQLRAFVEDQGIRRIVLDLRNDPGGFVDQARTIASQFVGSGPIYWEENSQGRQVPQEAAGGGVATDPSIRLVVLVNGGTASASEIVAGALHDTGRATLVGETTYGKGTIQQWHLLNDGEAGGFRLSVAKWLTPNKTWIHGVGITPDVVVPVGDGTAADQDPQLDRAVKILTSETGSGVEPAAPFINGIPA